MNLVPYEYQFYSHYKPTLLSGSHNDGNIVAVADIDLQVPPPKPPRTFTTPNNRNAKFNSCASQQSWTTLIPTTSAAQASFANCLVVPNETPKSIYTRSLLEEATTDSAELQLRPKLDATQKRRSAELRGRILQISRRSSGFIDDDDLMLDDENDNEGLQPEPQHGTENTNKLHQSILEMFEGKSNSLTVSSQAAANTMPRFQMPSKSSFDFNKSITNASTDEKITSNEISSNMNMQNLQPYLTHKSSRENDQPQDATPTVKERINFFNKLSSPTNSSSLVSHLKNGKTTNLATRQNTITMKSPLPKQLESNLQRNGSTLNDVQLSQTTIRAASTRSSCYCTQYKCRPIVHQNSKTSSSKTKLHKKLAKLILSMPVKLRRAACKVKL